MLVAHLIVFGLGAALVVFTLASAIRTFVVPRGINDVLTRIIFMTSFQVFRLWLKRARRFDDRDRILALYAPITLLAMPVVWLGLVQLGYTGMFWALGVASWGQAYATSGSSLLTLGFAPVNDLPTTLLAFSEATLGLILVALLIAYLPTIYSAFSKREAAVTMLETRAGSPPSAVEMLKRFHRFQGLDRLNEVWVTWEAMFAEMEESHTTLPVLSFFRSHQPRQSWITSAGAVLDAAALSLSAIAMPNDPNAHLCIRAGYLCLRQIAAYFNIPHNPYPHPDDPISISRDEFERALDDLAAQGVPVREDRDQAWRDFAGWRVNYDFVLRALAGLIQAPYAPWSSDRAIAPHGIMLRRKRESWEIGAAPVQSES